MSKELLAKDKRRWSKRKGITVAAAVVGGVALVGLGYYLYRKLFYDVKTPNRTDWSGCFEPPDWVQPRPRFSCGTKVTYPYADAGNQTGYITSRTWSTSMSTDAGEYLSGMWVYETTAGWYTEEANLQVA